MVLRCLGAGVLLQLPYQMLSDFSLNCRKKQAEPGALPGTQLLNAKQYIDNGYIILKALTLSRYAVTGTRGTFLHPSPPSSSLLVSLSGRRRPKLSGRGFSPSSKGCVSSWRTMPIICWLSWGAWRRTLRKCRKRTSLA